MWVYGWYASSPLSDLQERLKWDLRISVTEYRVDAHPGWLREYLISATAAVADAAKGFDETINMLFWKHFSSKTYGAGGMLHRVFQFQFLQKVRVFKCQKMALRASKSKNGVQKPRKTPPKWLGRHLGHAFPFSGEYQAKFWKSCF